MNDAFGDRMKMFEQAEAGRRFMPLLPVLARLDGKGFSKFTKGMDRPYDVRLSNLMIDTTAHLVKETNACCGYTQSDEITLAWYSDDINSQIFFDGKIQKMVSVLASMCSVYFNSHLPDMFDARDIEHRVGTAVFDCRCWQVPSLVEGANAFLWREYDATKNSISMAASSVYSHKQLDGKNGSEKQELLHQKGINWNDYPSFFKRGSYIQRRVIKSKLRPEDLESLPEKHHARLNPDLEIERSEIKRIDMPRFSSVFNRADVIFRGEEPVMMPSISLTDDFNLEDGFDD